MLLFIWFFSSLTFAIDGRYAPLHEVVKNKLSYSKDYNGFLEDFVVPCQLSSVRIAKDLNIPFGEYLLLCPWLAAEQQQKTKSPDQFDPEMFLRNNPDSAKIAMQTLQEAGLKPIEQRPVAPKSERLRLYLEKQWNTKIDARMYEREYTETCYSYVACSTKQSLFLCLYFAAEHLASGSKEEFWPASKHADLAQVKKAKNMILKKFPRTRFAPGLRPSKRKKYEPLCDSLPAEKKIPPPYQKSAKTSTPVEKQRIKSPKGVCGCATSTSPTANLGLLFLLAFVAGMRRRL